MKTTYSWAKLRPELIEDHQVFATITKRSNLLSAWSHVWQNGGCSGGDNVTVEVFRQNVSAHIATLSNELINGDYSPRLLRQVLIPKSNSKIRTLNIPSVIDRVAQTCVAKALTPLLEDEFEDSSFGYRPGRSVNQAVNRISTLQKAGAAWVVDADIENFFDNVSHELLLERLSQSMTVGPLTHLIALWLEHGSPYGRGLPQGSPLSPLLSNLFLDRLDEAFAHKKASIVRYADDFVILCENAKTAGQALSKTQNLLADHGLKLNEEKTRVLSFDKGFRFLGHLFMRSLVLKSAAKRDEEDAIDLLRQLASSDSLKLVETENLNRKKRAGLDPGLRVLYVMQEHRRLSVRNEAFIVEEAVSIFDETGPTQRWHEILALPNSQIDRIEIGPRASATDEALSLALACDTPLAFVNGWGETKGWVSNGIGPRAGRHMAQAQTILNPDARLELAKQFVGGRIRNQRALLRRLNRSRKNPATLKALTEINYLVRRVPHAKAINILMGVEGRTAALFWPAIGRALEGGFRFNKRTRQGKINPVNIMLNMTANMLTRDVTIALQRAGLHTGFGVLHATQDHRDALAYDLMEEFRAPLCESVVVTAINTKVITRSMFKTMVGGGSRMLPDASKNIIKAYERAIMRPIKSPLTGKQHTWRNIISQQAFLLAAHMEGREQYKPYIMDY